jgi:hypothetical protein
MDSIRLREYRSANVSSLLRQPTLESQRGGVKNLHKTWERVFFRRDIATMMKGLGDVRASKKAKYVFKKSALYQIVDEIEKWQVRYDPTWILIMQMSIGNIDEELHKQQKKPEREQIR